jgi:GH24 family phage-related lysozyme (muramidase)
MVKCYAKREHQRQADHFSVMYAQRKAKPINVSLTGQRPQAMASFIFQIQIRTNKWVS